MSAGSRLVRRLCLLAGATLLCGAGPDAGPIAAPIHPVATRYYGDTLSDPYRWMEAMGPDFLAWVHARNAVTRRTFDGMPGYPALARAVTAASDAEVRVHDIQAVGGVLYYERQGAGEAQASLYARPIAGGAERRLVDPVALGDATTAINDYAVSPDNRRLALSLASGGSEDGILRFIDLTGGGSFSERVDRGRQAGPVWSADGRFVFYNRLKATFSGPADRFADETIYRHRPGDDPAHDVPIFTAAAVGSELGAKAFIGLFIPTGSRHALAFANSGVSHEAEWFEAPTASLVSGGMPHWSRIARLADGLALTLNSDDVVQPVVHGDEALFASLRNAPRGQVVAVDLRHPDAAHARVVVPEPAAGRLTGIAAASDGLYVATASGGRFALQRAGPGGGRPASLPLPYAGTIDSLVTDPTRPGAVVLMQSWARPADAMAAGPGGVHALELSPPFALDVSSIVAETITTRAADGVQVPISVIHRRDLRRDGSAPALIEAYGAYGNPSEPGFRAQLMPFLLRGGVWAVVHVRGGGEFGEAWHLAGKGATKPNTWRDFIAGVGTLEAAGYTSAAHTVGFGASAGGIMIGRVVTERPDLLAGAVMWAPISNALRMETTEGGPANTAEFGSTATLGGYTALRAMDTYSHVAAGTRYPPVLITIGLNDHRVPPWMGAELAARLSADTSSGRPVLLRVDDKGGHHMMGAAKADFDAQVTDMLAFLMSVTGDPAFRMR